MGISRLRQTPVADVAPVAVEFGADAAEHVGGLPGDELLHVLVGPVVVGQFEMVAATP